MVHSSYKIRNTYKYAHKEKQSDQGKVDLIAFFRRVCWFTKNTMGFDTQLTMLDYDECTNIFEQKFDCWCEYEKNNNCPIKIE